VYDGFTSVSYAEGSGWAAMAAPMVDANGDGRVDVCTAWNVLITAESGWRFVALPNDLDPTSIWRNDYHACLPDVTGDGYGDLLMAHYDPTNIVSSIYSFGIGGGPITLHPGGPDGYGEPVWTELGIDKAVYSARAIQADDDPELELALLAGYVGHDPFYGYPGTPLLPDSWLLVLDDVGTTPVVIQNVRVGVAGGAGLGLPQLSVLGDIDGDGIDDLALPEKYGDAAYGSYDHAEHHVRLVSGASAAGSLDTLALLSFVFDDPEADVHDLIVRAHDLNEDGHMDLYGFASVSGSTVIQVWYGPLYEAPEPPQDTGDTGDTGDGSDTGTSSTGTASTGDTAGEPTPPAKAKAPPDDKGCGCSSGPAFPASALMLPWAVARQRRR
jgi:hypothetical protein